MSKGIIYAMTTAVSGLIKIGKTRVENFEQRMYFLEKNGYSNVTALKRKFAIIVDDYEDKETLLDEIFSKSKVFNTELYALDIDLVIQLLSSLEGEQIYPKEKSKEEVFDEATRERVIRNNQRFLPDGEYYYNRKIKGFGEAYGKALVKDGIITVLAGSVCAPTLPGVVPEVRRNAVIVDNILKEDVICTSPSSAGWIVSGRSNNGWVEWKNKHGQSIDVYRKINRKG
ncbi:DUF4357 domain-containing protein [Ignavigranum ruoffiae]|uniref:Bacteriophage T5 Orf172 DNA-binding domain-containing protein n=1 Tax=Ignavigranum ruoffiae TaxID=89093 RepID=A0A1H9GHU5_9LACT|nr:DUF4357 domain-containing protein [Ignavigranum ruoffiae]SEQ49593.1 protein of unknown function [Ignavigranum ruoffiae]